MTKPTLPRRPNESYTARYRREQGEATRAKPGAAQKNITRSIAFGAVALLVVVVWLVVELGADRDEMLDFVGTSLFFIGVPLVLGVAAGALLVGYKWLRRRLGRRD